MKKPYKKLYLVECTKRVLKKDIPALSADIRSIALEIINGVLTTNPTSIGRKLLGEFEGHRRIEVKNYRMIYCVDTTEHKVDVISVKHRQGVYKKFKPQKH